MNARHTCRVIVQCGLLPHQVLEEGLGGEVRVVLLGQRALHVDDLEAAQLEAALLEAGNDLADESALRGVAGEDGGGPRTCSSQNAAQMDARGAQSQSAAAVEWASQFISPGRRQA